MNKQDLPILALGVTIAVAFFLPFLDIGVASRSGLEVVLTENAPWTWRIALLAMPITGVALAVGGLTGHRKARPLGLFFGLGVFAFFGYYMVKFFFATTGIGLWLTLAAAIAGPILAIRRTRTVSES